VHQSQIVGIPIISLPSIELAELRVDGKTGISKTEVSVFGGFE
jgi:hypothetical protein